MATAYRDLHPNKDKPLDQTPPVSAWGYRDDEGDSDLPIPPCPWAAEGGEECMERYIGLLSAEQIGCDKLEGPPGCEASA
jgi:hypothetical protein